MTIEGLTVKGKEHVGGLTAFSSGGIIQNCTIKATENYPVLIWASCSKVGGFDGNTSGNISGSNTIKGCTISGWQSRTSITVGGSTGTSTVNITYGGGNKVTYTN